MVKVNPLNTNEYSYQTGNASQNEQKTKSVFDVNHNNKVDEEDFGNNQALIEIADESGWLHKAWDEVGNAVKNLFKNIKIDDADTVYGILEKMSEKCDLNDGANISSVLCAIANENSIIHNENKNREDLFKKLFKDEYQGYNMYKDGGSLKFILKNGDKVFQNIRMDDEERLGWVVIVHSNGTKEVFDSEGIVQPANSMDDICEKYKL